MASSILEIRQAMMVISMIPAETMVDHEQRAKRSELVTKVVTSLMSGRWHRRDGDSYGIVRQPGVPRPDANDPPGDLRSPNQRRD
jgi:hypothetical protein